MIGQYWRAILREIGAAVLPVSVTVAALALTVVPLHRDEAVAFLVGTGMIAVGLFLFLFGVRIGFIPLGEFLGSALPQRGSLALLLIAALVLGFVVTIAEPDVRVLAHMVARAGGDVSTTALIVTVAAGVGFFALISMLRVFLRIPLPFILLVSYILAFALSPFVPTELVSVAFDSGGVTTGPVTVPFIIALNVGVVSVIDAKERLAASFGLVALASVGPILAVLLLALL